MKISNRIGKYKPYLMAVCACVCVISCMTGFTKVLYESESALIFIYGCFKGGDKQE